MEPIRILVVDDHIVVRQGLVAMLSPRIGMAVTGEAANGREAIRLAEELNPDVIIMDLLMPDMDGIEATRSIKSRNPHAHILILTSFDERERAMAVLGAGASGYLLKDSGADELMQAIRAVHNGQVILTPQVMQIIANPTAAQDDPFFESIDLTPRELQVLQGVVDGLTNQAIAVRLDISHTTVRSHVSNVLVKLNVTNRTQAALVAREHHLLEQNE